MVVGDGISPEKMGMITCTRAIIPLIAKMLSVNCNA
jgi:hypothetical protein